MKKPITRLILFACLFISSLAIGQEQTRILCGQDLLMQTMEQNHPGFQEAIDNTLLQAKQRGAENRLTKTQSVYTIPVVVHIVWKDSTENLADSVVLSQMDVLNEDFRRLNADAGNLRPMFDSVVGDPMIEFTLDSIIRVETTADFAVGLFTGLPDNVKQTNGGGSDAWNTESYLNIWVCHIQPLAIGPFELGQVLGYAYPPADLPNWPADASAPSPELDGVVIDYRVFGKNNPNDIEAGGEVLEIAGRTPIHEVGHYLGLRHVWGDGGTPFDTAPDASCGDDDFVDDTPNTGSQAAFSCDTTRNTCIDSANDLPDMIENYMDYSSEVCMNSFTKGQIDIMRGVIEGPRCGLVNNCPPPPTSINTLAIKANDLKIFPNPTTGVFQINLKNEKAIPYTLAVKNILGQTVMLLDQSTATTANYTIDLSSKTSGIYLVEVRTEDGTFAKKLMKF